VVVDKKGIKDSWKKYMEKLMNEENEWDHGISAQVKEGPADCIRIGEVVAAMNKSSAVAEMGDHGHKQTWAKKSGAAVPFFLGDHRTQSHLGRGLPPYQVAS